MKTKKSSSKGIFGMSVFMLISAVILTVCNLSAFNKYNTMMYEGETASVFYDNSAKSSSLYMSDKHMAQNDNHGESTLPHDSFFYGWR